MNRPLLESAHAELMTYQETLTAAVTALGAFLALPIPHPPAPAAAPPPVPAAAEPARAVRTKGATTADQKTRLAKRETAPSAGEGLRILQALVATSPQRPGDVVEQLGLSPHTFKRLSTTLEGQGFLTFSGKTISRRVAITDAGRKAASGGRTVASARPQSDADLVAARDKAIKDRLKTGPATFDQLLAAMPGEYPSADAKAAALKASLRRLTLRSEVLDAGNQFKLRAA